MILSPVRIIFLSLFLFAFFLFSHPAWCQSNVSWRWQNPLPQGDGIQQVFFVNSTYGWMVPFSKNIMRTTDGGDTWTLHPLPIVLEKLTFVNPYKGWAVGRRDGFKFPYGIYKTSDGGLSWTNSIPDTLSDDGTFMHLVFSDENHGWHTSQDVLSKTKNGMLRTTDGGKTWFAESMGELRLILAMEFRDSLNGAIGTIRYLGRTTDGGKTWDRDSSLTGYAQIKFVDSLNGWASTPPVTFTPSILRTTDGGATWNPTAATVKGLLFPLTPTLCYVLGDSGVYKTINSGGQWLRVSSETFKQIGEGVERYFFFPSDQEGWVVSRQSFFRTQDGGTNWTRQDFNALGDGAVDLWGIDFLDEDTGWVTGSAFKESSFQYNFVAKSIDGGRTWEIQNRDIPSRPRKITFINHNTGWVIGANGMILKTTNGGGEWNLQPSGTSALLWDLDFIDEKQGWIAGDGVLLRTNHGGGTWSSVDFGPPTLLDCIQFTDSLHGWAAGHSPQVGTFPLFIRTEDGGIHWTPLPSPSPYVVSRFHFFDTLKGWAILQNPSSGTFKISFTSDGGTTWGDKFSGDLDEAAGIDLGDILFVDSLQGLAVGGFGTIVRTTNGGITWLEETGKTSSRLRSLEGITGAGWWIIGTNGTILNLIDGSPTSITSRDFTIERTLEPIQLYPNHPNPFNSSTIISYQVNEQLDHVTIELVDILGRTIKVIEEGSKPPGVYNLMLDAQGLPSGLYFYRVSSRSYVKVGRALFLK